VPKLNAWVPISTVNAPEPRFNHVAVWTGKEMVVWGGYTDSHSWYAGAHAPGHLNTGGRYNPARNAWRSTTQSGAPSARINHVGVWTGSGLIVWGGVNASEALNDGGSYDPVEDSWRTINLKSAPEPRCMPAAVWTGKEMLVWGGATRDGSRYFNNGGRYDPGTDTWRPLSTDGAPKGRMFAQAVWTGRHMLVWGGVNDEGVSSVADPARYQGTGGLYDPETDSWRPISLVGAPSPRLTTAVWTGHSLLAFGGYNNVHLNDLHELLIEE
jgi:N-acetylneuraminic acid mutarotase